MKTLLFDIVLNAQCFFSLRSIPILTEDSPCPVFEGKTFSACLSPTLWTNCLNYKEESKKRVMMTKNEELIEKLSV